MIELFHQDELLHLYRGDCRALELPEPADHILTDFPYSEETHTGARSHQKASAVNPTTGKRDLIGSGERLIDFDSVTFDQVCDYLCFLTPLCKRWLIAFMDWHHVARLEALLSDKDGARALPGLRFVRFGIWDKPNGAPQFTGDRPGTGWEAIAILHRAGGRMRWNGGGRRAVWRANKIEGIHPTQKAPRLLRDLLWDFTEPGDHILDPFAGSFEVARQCKVLGRRCTAVELDPDGKYCDYARQAVRAVSPQRDLFNGPAMQAGLFEEAA